MSSSCTCSSQSNGCGSSAQPDNKASWITGAIETSTGSVPTISTELSRGDRLNAVKVRWGIGRMKYQVPPGLYAVGQPDRTSPVLVTANYKLTFDRLRSRLSEINAWILVLDTKGINVWCAAGKGTFGTDELVNRIRASGLEQVVDHRKIILPQLGAPGVAAHIVKKSTGFKVEYGPVYAQDIPGYILNQFQVKPEMRRVRFPLRDRLALIPMELIPALKFVPIFLAWLVIVQLLRDHRLSVSILRDLVPYLSAILSGAVLFQILLPWLPFRSFIINGWLLGGAVILALCALTGFESSFFLPLLLILPPISAFLAVNFTGSTTFTSLSGVRKELSLGVPVMILSVVAGIVIQIVMSV